MEREWLSYYLVGAAIPPEKSQLKQREIASHQLISAAFCCIKRSSKEESGGEERERKNATNNIWAVTLENSL